MALTSIQSPNMGLPVPVVGVDPGPQYAIDVNNSLTLIDGHNHSAGSGVQITPAGLNINAPLSLNGNTLTNIAALTLAPQSAAPANGSIYESGVDLHYIDGNGVDIPITAGGVVNATSSGISSGTASAQFVGSVLVVNANVNTPANIQGGSILLGNNIPASNFLTLSPPAAMGASYSLTLPVLPAQTNVMTLNTSGTMSSVTFDAVGTSMTSVGANAIAASRTRSVSAISATVGNFANGGNTGAFATTSTSFVNVTNGFVSINTSGRPVMLVLNGLQAPTTGNEASIQISNSSGTPNNVYFEIIKSAPVPGIGTLLFLSCSNASEVAVPPGAISWIDLSTAGTPATYQYFLNARCGTSGMSVAVNFCNLVAYEL